MVGFASGLIAIAMLAAAPAEQPGWQTRALPFRALSISSNGQALWVCGTDEGIAVSTDDGRNWKVVHHEAPGRVLLNIAFGDAGFGYAAGSNGLLLTTADAGNTWAPMTTNGESILQAAFGDARHGILRTASGLFFTQDGGAHWPPLPVPEALKSFRYSYALAAVDAKRMLVVLKEGRAPFDRQAFVFTADGGATWIENAGPDAILDGFATTAGAYLAAGVRTAGKNGRSVPVLLSSTDGREWIRSGANLSACQDAGCSFCTRQGCLAANGTLAGVFKGKVDVRPFPPNDEIGTAWAATDSAICLAASSVQCAAFPPAKRAPQATPLPRPPLLTQPALGSAATAHGPACLICGLDLSTLASHGRGSYELRLTIHIAPNGTVASVDVAGAPSDEIADRVRRRVSQWIYEPTFANGVAVAATATSSARVDVESR